MGLFVKFWGTRGSIPTPGWKTRTFGGNTPCVALRSGETLFICDAGTGVRSLGQYLLKNPAGPVVGHFFFSHPHWDHIQGFPFFVPAYVPGNRFYIYGTEAGDQRFYDLLSGQMQSDYFPVAFSELAAEISPRFLAETGEIYNVGVDWLQQRHPGGSLAYKFSLGPIKVVYATDNELDLALPEAPATEADPTLLREVDPAYLEFIRGAELLIADGQYTDEEYPSRVNWGHARATTVVDAAVQAGVKRLAIFHHDPMHGDDAVAALVDICRRRAKAQSSPLEVFAAREGVELHIG